MAQDKDGIEESAGGWQTAARINGFYCERCGEIPPYEERETYFEMHLCDWCRHQSQKDD